MSAPQPRRMPNENATLKVMPASRDESRKMAVFDLGSADIHGLENGAKVTIWVDAKDRPVQVGRISLRALSAFIPRIAHAVHNHKNDGGSYIEDVLLPDHHLNSYKKLLGWIWASIKSGRVAHFHRVTKHTMATYNEVRDIADDLAIGWLANAMKGRLDHMRGNSTSRDLITTNAAAVNLQ